MANSVDPDQTAPEGESDQGLHCLLSPSCPNFLGFLWYINRENLKNSCGSLELQKQLMTIFLTYLMRFVTVDANIMLTTPDVRHCVENAVRQKQFHAPNLALTEMKLKS